MWKSLKLTEDSDPQSLSRNDAVREALAGRLGLTDQADYLDISELLVQRIYEFVKNVENENANSLQGVMGTSSSINCPFR